MRKLSYAVLLCAICYGCEGNKKNQPHYQELRITIGDSTFNAYTTKTKGFGINVIEYWTEDGYRISTLPSNTIVIITKTHPK